MREGGRKGGREGGREGRGILTVRVGCRRDSEGPGTTLRQLKLEQYIYYPAAASTRKEPTLY